MIVVQALLIAGVPAAEIRCHVLDDRTVYTIRLAKDEPTTCVFPGTLTALEVGNVSTKPEDAPPVLLSHQPGASFFSLRALRDGAKAAVNVVYRGRVYALTLVTAAEPDRAVTFLEPAAAEAPAPAKPLDASALRSLLGRARHHDLVVAQYPLLAHAVERATPNTETLYPGFKVTVTEVFRFPAEDALVFHARLESENGRPVRFDPSGVAIRVGAAVYPAALAEVDDAAPASGSSLLRFIVAGDGHGGSASLSVHNTFFVLVPALP